jgi:hypothetical protein
VWLLLVPFYLTFGWLRFYLLLASCAQLASYLCLLIYVTLSIYACLFAPKGQISKHKTTEGEIRSQLRTKSKHKATLSISPSVR